MSRVSRVQTYEPPRYSPTASQMPMAMAPMTAAGEENYMRLSQMYQGPQAPMAPQYPQYPQAQVPWIPQARLFADMDSHVNTDRLISVLIGVVIGVLIMMVYNSSKQQS